MAAALLIGFLCGFIGSIPIAGPTSAAVVSRGLERRTRAAIYVAIGSALPEALYACLAFWGLVSIFGRHPDLVPLSRLVGSAIVVGLGVYFALHRIRRRNLSADAESMGGWRDLVLGFSMTIANPTLIVTWTATIGVVHSAGLLPGDRLDALPFAAGVAGGIVGWFGSLIVLLRRFRERMNVRALERIIHTMGAVLIAGGIGLCVRALAKWP